jgi:isopentenyl-diphosphate Delta-isomerase
MAIEDRKNDHILINLNKEVHSGRTTGLERFHFVNQSLPEINLPEVNPSVVFFGKRLSFPLMISSMTGGTESARLINENLARTANQYHLAMGLGSMRIVLEDPNKISTFQVRKFAPEILLFANLGAIQLNYGIAADDCKKLVELAEADGLILHLNSLQEALQPEGNTNFKGLTRKIEILCKTLNVPVIVKEIGWGLSEKTARTLINAGVAALDIAGAGGTSWSEVEKYRAADSLQFETSAVFKDWGIPLVESLQSVRRLTQKIPIVASGGIRSGVDIAKCIALGANLCGIAGGFLKTAAVSLEDSLLFAGTLQNQLKVAMFAAGVSSIPELMKLDLSQDY